MIRELHFLLFPATLLLMSVVPNVQASPDNMPDVSGEWVNLDKQEMPTGAIVTIEQEGRDISGKFTDRKAGRVLVDADLIGYVETDGTVIFDVYFGRVTSTNRLRLSGEGDMLTGSFTNTIGGEGNVTLRRKR